MLVFKEKTEARNWVLRQRCRGERVGLVPTMGALHEGHLQLVRNAAADCDLCVATIFVNPKQFAPDEDFARYPRTLQQDLDFLRSAGVAAVFVPDDHTMYSASASTVVQPPRIAEPWEGQHRPHHFQGVTTVVSKLFNILPVTHAFFGHKDFQQAIVIQRMNKELDFGIEIKIVATVRERDGLALSSRNRYLSLRQREQAAGLFAALRGAHAVFAAGQRQAVTLEKTLRDTLAQHDITEIDYAVAVPVETLEPVPLLPEQAITLLAVRLGTTRLIDNLRLDEPMPEL